MSNDKHGAEQALAFIKKLKVLDTKRDELRAEVEKLRAFEVKQREIDAETEVVFEEFSELWTIMKSMDGRRMTTFLSELIRQVDEQKNAPTVPVASVTNPLTVLPSSLKKGQRVVFFIQDKTRIGTVQDPPTGTVATHSAAVLEDGDASDRPWLLYDGDEHNIRVLDASPAVLPLTDEEAYKLACLAGNWSNTSAIRRVIDEYETNMRPRTPGMPSDRRAVSATVRNSFD